MQTNKQIHIFAITFLYRFASNFKAKYIIYCCCFPYAWPIERADQVPKVLLNSDGVYIQQAPQEQKTDLGSKFLHNPILREIQSAQGRFFFRIYKVPTRGFTTSTLLFHLQVCGIHAMLAAAQCSHKVPFQVLIKVSAA